MQVGGRGWPVSSLPELSVAGWLELRKPLWLAICGPVGEGGGRFSIMPLGDSLRPCT